MTRLALHPEPSRPYFVPVAPLGLHPTECSPFKQPHISRCRFPLAVGFPTCFLLPLVSYAVRRFPLGSRPSSLENRWTARSKRPLVNPRKSHSVQLPSLPEGSSSCCAELVDPRSSPVWADLGTPEGAPYCSVFSGSVCVSKPVVPLLDGSEDLPGVWHCSLFRTRAASQARHPVDCRRSRSGNDPPKGFATKLTVVSAPRLRVGPSTGRQNLTPKSHFPMLGFWINPGCCSQGAPPNGSVPFGAGGTRPQ